MRGVSRGYLAATLFGVLFLGLRSTGLSADSDSCTAINAVPTTISRPGVYCLNRDMATSIAGGIFAENRENITIRNGTIKGFAYGILFNRIPPGIFRGHLIERVRLESSTLLAIDIVGNGSVIRNGGTNAGNNN